MMGRKLRALFVDAVEQHANAMRRWGFGLSTGLQEPSVGMIICLDPSITIHGLRNCESTEAKTSLCNAGHRLHLPLPHEQAVFL